MPVKEAYRKQAATLIKKMEQRQFEAVYCDTKSEAFQKVLDFISIGSSVTCGGSATIKELGLKEFLLSDEGKNYHYINRDLAKDLQSKREVFSKAVLADYYLMSTNAITEKGELVNIDGDGNRVACLNYGPENVIVIASMNKVVKDVEMAIERVRNIAAPANAIRLNCETACSKTGFCGDCLMPDCICSQILVTRFSRIKNRIKVILVGESLGF
jgi:L-lactate utilization protein LutC